jgi:hypothetical protein
LEIYPTCYPTWGIPTHRKEADVTELEKFTAFLNDECDETNAAAITAFSDVQIAWARYRRVNGWRWSASLAGNLKASGFRKTLGSYRGIQLKALAASDAPL